MPRLSDTMDTGTIGKWLKQEGDSIKKGDIVAEIETDKANMEMESYASGILAVISVKEGESAGVGEPIAIVAANEEEAQKLKSGGGAPAAASAPAEAATSEAATSQDGKQQAQTAPSQAPPAAPQVGGMEPEERIKASPLARRLAQEHGINLLNVAGTGPGGRITKEDVQSFLQQAAPIGKIEERPAAAPEAAPAAPPAPAPQPSPQPAGAAALRGAQPVEMTRMQQTIARRMAESKFSKPEFVLTIEVDMTDARALLRSFAGMEGGARIGPNDFLIKAVASALTQHPEMNAGWENDGVVQYSRINIGNAVAIPGGLIVPVIKDANQKSLSQISRESKELIGKARDGKLAPSEFEGGTFTISNLGMFGIEQFTPIINAPEAGIMGVGSIVPKPVVLDGEITVRERMRITLSADHRVVNGAQGAEFLQTLRRLLENPMLAVL
jgi:pyruvate dehydrogenase E2 component (dihydrolipoamide acetyltransferase)